MREGPETVLTAVNNSAISGQISTTTSLLVVWTGLPHKESPEKAGDILLITAANSA